MKKKETHFSVRVFDDAQTAVVRGLYIPISLDDELKKPVQKLDSSDTQQKELNQIDSVEMYSNLDQQRCLDEEYSAEEVEQQTYRTEFRRDYARIIHSPSFRRLQGKTQLFPCFESDFFRNRLTHSLEVAQIAKTIADKINRQYFKDDPANAINLDLIEVAGLAHDLGHPPFGHQGEEALNECMRENGGFEGNAQTLRLLSKIEKKRQDGFLELGGFNDYGEDKRMV